MGAMTIEKASITLDINKSVMQELRIIFSTGQALLKYEVYKRYKLRKVKKKDMKYTENPICKDITGSTIIQLIEEKAGGLFSCQNWKGVLKGYYKTLQLELLNIRMGKNQRLWISFPRELSESTLY